MLSAGTRVFNPFVQPTFSVYILNLCHAHGVWKIELSNAIVVTCKVSLDL